jgi:hypothetical protein
MLLLRAREEHQHLLLWLRVLDGRILVYVRLQQLEARLVLLYSDRL